MVKVANGNSKLVLFMLVTANEVASLDGVKVCAGDDETLLAYLQRILSECQSLLRVPGDPLTLTRELLPLHMAMLKSILGEKFYASYLSTLRGAFSGMVECNFWSVVSSLYLHLHFQNEILEVARERVILPPSALDTITLDEYMKLCVQRCTCTFDAIQTPAYISSHWVEKVRVMARDSFIQARSIRVFDDILDYPASQAQLLELREALVPGSLTRVLEGLQHS